LASSDLRLLTKKWLVADKSGQKFSEIFNFFCMEKFRESGFLGFFLNKVFEKGSNFIPLSLPLAKRLAGKFGIKF